MTTVNRRVLDELPLPLGPGAGILDVLALAVAVEDACGVTLPDSFLTAEHLGCRESIEAVLSSELGDT